MKKLISFALAFVLAVCSALALVSCGGSDSDVEGYNRSAEETDLVCMTVRDYGAMIIELRPDCAPVTVDNFKDLVSDGFYDGLTFHRISKNFMIQGGDPNGNGTGDTGKKIYGEFSANGYSGNTLKHERGTISMARGAYDMNSASCQFFIVHKTSLSNTISLDGQYAAFGKVIEGLDVLDSIANIPCVANSAGEVSMPVVTPVIEAVYFVTKA